MSNVRASHWSLTINNPTDADYEEMARARQKGWTVDGQVEMGQNGTPHLQLYLRTPQVRFAAVKKAFTRAHIEVARNAAALAQYVTKEDTRVGSLPVQSDRYPSLSKFWHLVYQNVMDQNWLDIRGDSWWRQAFDDFNVPRRVYDRYSGEDGHMPLNERHSTNEMIAKEVFESSVAKLIEEGYHVEHYFSPPNISVFKKFHFELLARSRRELEQTASQTDTRLDDDEESVADEHTHVSEVQQVQVPTLDPPPTPPSDGTSSP